MIVAFILLLERRAHFGSLERRFLPNSQTGIWIGISATACGMALAIWARSHLGANWSATITIRTSHSLVSTGPYARLRHPIFKYAALFFSGYESKLHVSKPSPVASCGVAPRLISSDPENR